MPLDSNMIVITLIHVKGSVTVLQNFSLCKSSSMYSCRLTACSHIAHIFVCSVFFFKLLLVTKGHVSPVTLLPVIFVRKWPLEIILFPIDFKETKRVNSSSWSKANHMGYKKMLQFLAL